MRSCEAYQEMISMMLDGELSAEQSEEVRAHIASCAECRAMYEAFSAIGGAELAEVPDTLHAKIMQGVEVAAKAKRTHGKILYLRRVMTAAACLIVVVGTGFALKNSLLPRRSDATSAAGNGIEMYAMAADSVPAEEAAEAPAEPAEPAAPAAFGAALEADTDYYSIYFSAEDSSENQAAEPIPAPTPEPKAKAEPQCMVAEIAEQTAGGYAVVDAETGEVWIMRISEDTQMTDEVRNALMPGCVVTVEYHTQETDEMSVIYADAIYFAE